LSAQEGTTTAPTYVGYYKQRFLGGCTQSVLEAHGGGGPTFCERSLRLAPGYKEKLNARATDI